MPSDLAGGYYLIRHEIIALHQTGQPQVSCVLFSVSTAILKYLKGSRICYIALPHHHGRLPHLIWDDHASDNRLLSLDVHERCEHCGYELEYL